MTCEICIMNAHAAVLAADSAVTLSHVDKDGKRVEKYHKGANKVFQLSEINPVGLMIYNAADLHNVPWEVIIKDYRKKNTTKTFATLPEYTDHLIEYIKSHDALFTAETKFKEGFVYLATIGQMLHLQFANEVQNNGGVVEFKVQDAEVYLKYWRDLSNSPVIKEKKESIFSPVEIDDAIKQFHGPLCDHLKDIPELAILTEEQKGQLVNIIIQVAAGFFEFKKDYTGLVITGYGEDEYFPTVNSIKCYGFILGKLVITDSSKYRIQPEFPSYIEAFAMKGMVETFVQGINRGDITELHSRLQEAFGELAVGVIKALDVTPDDAQFEILSRLINESRDTMMHDWISYYAENHTKSIRQVIGYLPIDEISDLAETMIVLESLKEKVTRPSQSVGGPIDVAVISKSEGFVWIKRKHYFNSELNPRFFKRNGYNATKESVSDGNVVPK